MPSDIPIKRILVAGGCGFIGSNFVRHELQSDPGVEITNLDALTYAGNPDNLADVEPEPRYRFVRGDIADRAMVLRLVIEGGFDAIVKFAAESHVDRSIDDATPFLRQGDLEISPFFVRYFGLRSIRVDRLRDGGAPGN